MTRQEFDQRVVAILVMLAECEDRKDASDKANRLMVLYCKEGIEK